VNLSEKTAMVRFRSAGQTDHSAARLGLPRPRWKPVLERLEDRCLLTCPNPPLEPWCRDSTFGNAGQAFVQPPLEGEAHAVAFENVGGEQRILLGGWAYDPAAAVQSGPNFALMRLTPDGALDPTFGHRGLSIAAFYHNSHVETINAIAIQQAISPVCGDTTTPTDKIVVAGRAYPHEQILPPSDEVIALMRFCANGQLDTAWGGHNADWWPKQPHPDPAGGVSVNIEQSNGTICHDWMRGGEALALAIEPGTNRIVVGGHGLLLKGAPGGGVSSYFVVARLNADGTYDSSFGGDDPCHNVGRVYFKGGTDHVEDEVHALALVPDVNANNWDILVAGPDEAPGATYHDVAVARVDDTGALDARFGNAGIQRIDFGQDAVAWDMAVRPADGTILVGGTTCPGGCNGLTPQSAFALARLTPSGELDYQRHIDVDYTNIGYSVTLQPQALGDPQIIIGGYSAASGGIPYMAGVRVRYDGMGTPAPFRSNFDTPSVSPGDQAWKLRVQDDNKILVGGVHTQANGPGFGIMRLCQDPDEASCSGGSSSSGGGHDDSAAPPAPDAVVVNPAVAGVAVLALNAPARVTAIQGRSAPPIPEMGAVWADAALRITPVAEDVRVALFAASDLEWTAPLTAWGKDPPVWDARERRWSFGLRPALLLLNQSLD
jgi:uncharacterized delta-60 repeat protein